MHNLSTFLIILFTFILTVFVFIRLISFPMYVLAKKQIRGYIHLENWITENGYQMRLPSFKKYSSITFSSLFRKSKDWNELQRFIFTGHYTTSELLKGSSYTKGTTSIGFTGSLENTKNKFLVVSQYERRGKAIVKRTVVNVTIPDTKLHMIINSKVNNDTASGGNITNYTNADRYQLESDFGKYFDVYMPDTTQSETLSILTPETMLYILLNMHTFDIEIVGNKLFLYTYKHLNTKELEQMITHIDHVIGEARITSTDVKKSTSQALQLSRRVGAHVGEQRSLRRFDRGKYYAFLLIASTLLMIFGVSIDSQLVIYSGVGLYLLLVISPMYQYAKELLRKRQLTKSLKGYK